MQAMLLAASLTLLGAPLESGLAKGESVSPFHPVHVSGPLAGSKDCFPCTFQSRPQIQAWVNGDDAKNVDLLAKALNVAVTDKRGKEFQAMIVFVTADEKKGKALAADLVKRTKADKIAVAVLDPKSEAVKDYKFNLSPRVKNTVFVYKDWKVTDKYANWKADQAGMTDLALAIENATK